MNNELNNLADYFDNGDALLHNFAKRYELTIEEATTKMDQLHFG